MEPIVLVGSGVNHYHFIKNLSPEETRSFVFISQEEKAIHPDWIPAVMAREISLEQAQLDFYKACQRQGVEWIEDRVIQLSREDKSLYLESYGKLSYSRISIEFEPVSALPFFQGGAHQHLISLYPLQPFLKKMEAFFQEVKNHCPREVRVVLSGCNQRNLSVAFAMLSRLKPYCPRAEVVMISEDADAFRDIPIYQRKPLLKMLKNLGLRVLSEKSVEKIQGHDLHFSDTTHLDFDIFIAGENFRPKQTIAPIINSKDHRVQVKESLQHFRDPSLFVHGPCVRLTDHRALLSWQEQVEVLGENLLREDEDDPVIDYRSRAENFQPMIVEAGRALGFRGPFPSVNEKFHKQWKQNLSKDRRETLHIAVNSLAQQKADRAWAYQVNHMSRPWSGSFSKQASISDRKMVSFRGFDWWGGYAQSAKQIVQMTLLKALAKGVRPEHFRFLLELPPVEDGQLQHVLESTYRGIEQVLDPLGVEMDGGETLNGDQWRLFSTLDGTHSRRGEPSFEVGDYVLITRPLGFGWLWAGRFADSFDGEWITQVTKKPFLPSFDAFYTWAHRWQPSAIVFNDEWGFLYHSLQRVPADGQLMINFREVPRWLGVDEVVKSGVNHPALDSNWNRVAAELAFSREEVSKSNSVLWDPLSQGSLVIGVKAAEWQGALQDLQKLGFEKASLIGCVQAKKSANKIILSDWAAL